MNVAGLLERLDGVRETGIGRWIARCPAHEDRSPSLSIRELPDGRILLHCFAGCSTCDLLAVVGLSLADLFPEPLPDAYEGLRRERYPFSPLDALRCISHEALIVAMHAGDPTESRPVDTSRLELAVSRILAALETVQ